MKDPIYVTKIGVLLAPKKLAYFAPLATAVRAAVQFS
jgi:hypothetical protein